MFFLFTRRAQAKPPPPRVLRLGGGGPRRHAPNVRAAGEDDPSGDHRGLYRHLGGREHLVKGGTGRGHRGSRAPQQRASRIGGAGRGGGQLAAPRCHAPGLRATVRKQEGSDVGVGKPSGGEGRRRYRRVLSHGGDSDARYLSREFSCARFLDVE